MQPLENADMVRFDLTLDIHKTIIPELKRSERQNPYLEAKVAANHLLESNVRRIV